jgi:ribonuclease Z
MVPPPIGFGSGGKAWVSIFSAMSLAVRFLGTSASRPTVERNVTALAIIREGETLLFDCGEGTQRQMMRYGISFSIRDIFFTHMHADHILGVIGLCRTMALQGRTDPMHLWGPMGSDQLLKRAIAIGSEKERFPIEVTELNAGDEIKRNGYRILTYPASHGDRIALGFALVEEIRLGRFNPDRAREVGIPEGPLWGKLHRGESVTLPDGRSISPETIVGSARPGRRVVYSGDSRPCQETIDAAQDADLLIHEATFADEEAPRALETGHSTAREAAGVAKAARAKQLVLTHLSARYSMNAAELIQEARDVFENTTVARDGMEIDVPFAPEEGDGDAS